MKPQIHRQNSLRSLFIIGVHTTTATLMTALVSGCSVGPDYIAPQVDLPAAWTTQKPPPSEPQPSNNVELERWWLVFQDPALNALIEHSVGTADEFKNFDLRIAASRLEEARALVQIAEAPWFPSVDFGASAQRSKISPNSLLGASAGQGGGGFSFLPGLTNNLYSLGFDALWELDFWGKTRRSVEAQDALLEATEENFYQMHLTLVAEVARNYVEYRAGEERIVAIKSNISAQRESLALTKARFDAGMTSQLDVVQAEAQLSTTEAQLPNLVFAKDQARNRLAVLLGEHPSFVDSFFKNHPGDIPSDISYTPQTLPTELLRKRPDVRAAERQLAASTAQIGVATSAFFPSFSLSLGGSLQSRESENWLDWLSRSWSVSPQVNLPIFQGGRLVGNLDAANERQVQAFENYKKVVFTSIEEVENSISAYQQEEERYAALLRAFRANKQAIDISQRLYTEGLADFLRVLEAERALSITEDSVVASKAKRITSLIALFKALGGGWTLAQEAN